jgi:hypothetical protein
MLGDYRIRVGHVTVDTDNGTTLGENDPFPDDQPGAATLITAKRPAPWTGTSNAADCAEYLSLNPYAVGMREWDVLEDMGSPGDLLLLLSWDSAEAAREFERHVDLKDGARLRRIRVERDYGMFERDQAPQYMPEVRLGTDCD